MLAREWNGDIQRVAVLTEGFAWRGETYPSLSKVAFAITGTRWNGPSSSVYATNLREERHREGRFSQTGSMRDLHARLD